MPLLHPPSPVAPAPRARLPWRPALAGGAGAAAIVALVAAGAAEPGPALTAAAAVGALAAVLSMRSWREGRQVAQALEALRAKPATDRTPPYAAVLATLPDPLMVIAAQEADDLAGRRVVFANAAARELFRLQGNEPLLVTAVRTPEVLEAVDESLFGGLNGEAAYETGGAQDRYWRALTRPLSPASDGSRLALLLLRDETDARRNERMSADFLANASHELRTPLASLAGFIETLSGHARDDQAARDRFLRIMAAQAERMSRLIDDLLSLSRIELNEHIAPGGRVDLAQAVTDVIDAMAPLLQETGVRIESVLPPLGQADAPGDRDQIVQVIQNLVDNAVKYSVRGGVVRVALTQAASAEAATALAEPGAARLSLLTPDHAGGERYSVLRVSDAGPGIAREHLPRLTERFYRVEGQKSGERLGTGLGLAIVKHIMNRHRGGLAVESLLGRGASFIVYFPGATAPVAAPDVAAGAPLDLAPARPLSQSPDRLEPSRAL